MFRKIICIFICLTLCLVLLPQGSAHAADETPVEKAQYSVVRVFCVIGMSNDGVYYSTGTGFAVGSSGTDAQIFATNNHVVEENPQNVYITITDLNGMIWAEVIYQDSEHDIAILKAETSISERHPITLMSPTELNKSQDVFCLGFPGLMDRASANEDLKSTVNDITITKGSVSNPTYKSNGISTILSDVKINSGNSGGPMVDEYGRAVGINTMRLSESGEESGESMSLAVSVDYLMDALDSLGLPYEKSDGTETEEPKSEISETETDERTPSTGEDMPVEDNPEGTASASEEELAPEKSMEQVPPAESEKEDSSRSGFVDVVILIIVPFLLVGLGFGIWALLRRKRSAPPIPKRDFDFAPHTEPKPSPEPTPEPTPEPSPDPNPYPDPFAIPIIESKAEETSISTPHKDETSGLKISTEKSRSAATSTSEADMSEFYDPGRL